jgi:ppGpp synthetase/RelA/SpoT-type nucleotidyltranferase
MPILDAHCEKLIAEYRQRLPLLERLNEVASSHLSKILCQQGIYVTAIEHRVKAEKSLEGKLELKGANYKTIDDITDLVGIRIITFYTDEVDKVAALVRKTFSVDWDESVDKRKMHQLNSFGYNSLHFICRLPKRIVNDPEAPELNTIRFEVQMRTALQHVWSTIEHDIGYKGVVHLPPEYRRQFSRLAGMLELIDDEFSRLRANMTEYTRQVQTLVSSGQLDEVPLNINTFRSYLELRPFDRLNQRIAAVNQAEIFPAPLMPCLRVLEYFQLETLGDVERFTVKNAEDAYQLALSGLAVTDLDIISESIGLQNLCYIHALKTGGGRPALIKVLDILNGERKSNPDIADSIITQAATLPCMTQKRQ